MVNDTAPGVDVAAQVRAACKRAGLHVEELDPVLLGRMELLAQRTATFDDNARAMELAERVFADSASRGAPFSATEQTTVRVGSLLSDIGKTGPRSATLEQQLLVATIFSVERVDNESMPVADFFKSYFPEQATLYVERFRSLGLDPGMTLRQFWNLHSTWTLELLRGSGVPLEAVAAAAAHHLLEHVNPQAMVDEEGRFRQEFGSNSGFDRAEKLVILLDKYDAVRRRGRRDHAAAIVWLRALIQKHPRFGQDREFITLIDELEHVLSHGAADLYA